MIFKEHSISQTTIWAIKNTPIPSHGTLVGWKRFPYGLS